MMRLAIGLVLGATVLGCGAGCSASSPQDSTLKTGYAVFGACQDAVKNQLKAPDTAKFDAANTDLRKLDKGKWEMTGKVSAQNSLGALLQTSWDCTATPKGGDYTATATVADNS